MKVKYSLELHLVDERNDDEKTIEVVCLEYVSNINFLPQIGMTIIIGENVDELSEHEVQEIIWAEKDDFLYVIFKDFHSFNDDEFKKDEEMWEYFDGLKKDFVEKDEWTIREIRGVRGTESFRK
jgi:hypothetical protein